MSEPSRLLGQVAVVTGGGSGIGAATVRRLVKEGAHVVAADIRLAAVTQIAADVGPACVPLQADVAEEADVAAMVDLAVTRFGRLDVMFNNAAVFGAYGPIALSRMDDVDRTWAINLRGVYLGMKYAAAAMRDQSSGLILSTTSPAAVMGGVGAHAYTAAKAAIVGLTRSVAAELRPQGIRVNAIMPGAVASAMLASVLVGDATAVERTSQILERDVSLGRPVHSDDIAAAVTFLASADGAMMTGQTLVVDGGYTAVRSEAVFATGRYADPGIYFAEEPGGA